MDRGVRGAEEEHLAGGRGFCQPSVVPNSEPGCEGSSDRGREPRGQDRSRSLLPLRPRALSPSAGSACRKPLDLNVLAQGGGLE